MIEKAYRFTHTDDFIMEKIIDEEHVNINHIVVAPGGSVPVHVANSHVHQIIVRGTISLKLEDEPVVRYTAGSIVAIPFNTCRVQKDFMKSGLKLKVIFTEFFVALTKGI